ncbi:hypothetical protein PG993_004224 [Apiospora rasikravindrae]|uniref:Uncharacterized protein n=1 Tax=Apiospora rasikravindrae TaxID=990691 RepID=A0ABR1TC75_9PEZI
MASYYDRPPPRDRGYDYGGPPPVSAADPYYPEPGASARRPRRGSILVDSAERDRGGPRRRHRSHSQVRLQEPEIDDSSDDDDPRYHPSSKPRSGAPPPPADSGRKVRHRDGRDGRVDYAPDDADKKMNSSARRPKPRTRVSDLEEKEGPQFRDFRARRDGYEAEEGKTHRNLKSSRGDRAIYDDGDDNDPYGLGGAGGGLPPPPVGSSRRGGPDPYDAALGAGAGAAAAAAGASARSGRRHEEPRRPRDRPPPTYHDDIGDRGYTSDAPKSRRNKDRSARQSLPPDYNRDRDRGDRYGGAPPTSARRASLIAPSLPAAGGLQGTITRTGCLPPKAMYDDDPPYGGRGEHAPTRSGSTRHPRGGPDDKHRARSAAYPQDPYYDFHDRRGGGGGASCPRDPRDPRAPYEEVADPRRPRGKSYGSPAGGSGRGGEAVKKERTVPPWAKKAGGFLVSTAVPIIKQEGEKYLRKEMERRLHK